MPMWKTLAASQKKKTAVPTNIIQLTTTCQIGIVLMPQRIITVRKDVVGKKVSTKRMGLLGAAKNSPIKKMFTWEINIDSWKTTQQKKSKDSKLKTSDLEKKTMSSIKIMQKDRPSWEPNSSNSKKPTQPKTASKSTLTSLRENLSLSELNSRMFQPLSYKKRSFQLKSRWKGNNWLNQVNFWSRKTWTSTRCWNASSNRILSYQKRIIT